MTKHFSKKATTALTRSLILLTCTAAFSAAALAQSSTASPAALLGGLANWKLTLPIGVDGASEKALDVAQPELATFAHPKFFTLNEDKTAVLMRATAGGARTSAGTAYSRTEMREMNGKELSAWNCTEEKRGMYIEQSLLKTTRHKPEVSVGQIHDKKNDNAMLKYMGPAYPQANGVSDTGQMQASFNNDTVRVIVDKAYTLGDKMSLDIATESGNITLTYKNLTKNTSFKTDPIPMTGVVGGCFFKAGIYIQACSKVDMYGRPNATCEKKKISEEKFETDPDAYSELSVTKVELR